MLRKEPFAHLPTKVETLPRLSEYLGGPEIIIKRDDQTGVALGGNKIRKLEFLIGEAIAEGAEMVLTTGAAQSNHCRQTAGAAARCGLDCTLVLVEPKPEFPSSNLLLDQLLGADIIWTEADRRDDTLQQAYHNAKSSGRKPYLIPYGGSNQIGAYGYFSAVKELLDQIPDKAPDWIVFASSSGGTQAGLVAGGEYLGLESKILGISVDKPKTELGAIVLELAQELSSNYGKDQPIPPELIQIKDDYLGDGYGIFNENDRQAIYLFAKLEGILLDPVYTGRAAGGLIDLIRKGFFTKDDRVLFWHTGGSPAIFAEKYQSDLFKK